METKDQTERLKKLIAENVIMYNFWGYLFSRIRRKEDKTLPSIMGVGAEDNGMLYLYYNPELLTRTTDKHVMTVLEHEGMHLLNKHIPRLIKILGDEVNKQRKNLKIKLWNEAADCAANEQANITQPIIINGEKWPPLLPHMFNLPSKKPTEYYFYKLLEEEDKKQEHNGDSGKNGGSGKGSFDDHNTWSNNIKDVADQSSLSRKIEGYLNNIVRDSVKDFESGNNRGNLPANVKALIDDMLKPPQVPYYQIIQRLVKGSRYSKFKAHPTKINRKRAYVFELGENKNIPLISPFPGKKRDLTFKIVVLIDTSGSMSLDDIKEGLNGIKNLIESDRYCETTVLEVDAGVEKEYMVKKIRDIQTEVKGRGGTTLLPGLQRARELRCDVCLAFTDGYVEDLNACSVKNFPKKIIWVITKTGTVDRLNRTGHIVKLKD